MSSNNRPVYIFTIFILISLAEIPISQQEIVANGNNTVESPSKVDSNSTKNDDNVDIDAREIRNITIDPHLAKLDEKFAKCRGIDIREITILQIQDLYSSGQLTAVELTQCYLTRIDRMNPVLKAVVEVSPIALEVAADLDEEFSAGHIRRPLHGIPILIKDGIATGDGMENTAGSLGLLGILPKADSEVVSNLRKAGAIILGKANLSEMFCFRGTNVPNGWSARGGQTRNAYNLNVSPEGSSSGSAVAVSANLCVASIGTETDGSLLAPASIAGVMTIKPTFNLVSLKGVIPLSPNQDHVGPMARTAMDLSIMLDAMVSESSSRPENQSTSYTDYIADTDNLQLFRVGVLRHPFWNVTLLNSTNLLESMPKLENMLDLMNNSANIEIVDPVEISNISLISQISAEKENTMLNHDFKHYFNQYLENDVIFTVLPNSTLMTSDSEELLATTRDTITSLSDFIQFYEEHPIPEGYNYETLSLAEATDGLLNETYIQAKDSNKHAAKLLLDSVLETYSLDVVITPSLFKPGNMTDPMFEKFPLMPFSIASIAGYPSINIPVGIGADGVPIGLTLIGKPYSEHVLLTIAQQMESLDFQRRAPRFLV